MLFFGDLEGKEQKQLAAWQRQAEGLVLPESASVENSGAVCLQEGKVRSFGEEYLL